MTAAVAWRGAHAERVQAQNEARVQAWSQAAGAGVRRFDVRAAAEASVASEGGAPNLESSTHLSQGVGYSVTVMDFGDGLVEARACLTERRAGPRTPRLSKEERAERKVQRDAERRAWSAHRAARSLRYRCLALKPDRMFTFTKRGKFGSVEELHFHWRRFYKLLSKLPNLDMPFVAVPELHGDGETWHLHVAVRGYQSVSFLRKLWYRALGGRGDETGDQTLGSVNVRYFESRRKAALCVASYMSKYLSKSFRQTHGTRKSYWCSHGLHPMTVQRYWEPYGDDIMIRVRDECAPMVPEKCMWRILEWEYVGLRGFVMKTY